MEKTTQLLDKFIQCLRTKVTPLEMGHFLQKYLLPCKNKLFLPSVSDVNVGVLFHENFPLLNISNRRCSQ